MFLTLEVIYIKCNKHMHYNLHKHFFSNRIIAVWKWNSLPNIIVTAESTNIFKNRLDRFWANQEIKFVQIRT